MLNCVLGAPWRGTREDRFRIRIAMIRVGILLRFKAPSFLFNPFVLKSEALLPSTDLDGQPIFFLRKGTSIFFIELAERIVGAVEIDQHFSSWHGFDVEIASLQIGLCLRGFIFKGKKKFFPP
jgi:hypothetical protein